MSDDLLPIGRFARLCRLSVKQLRHYDDLGLLAPAWTDPASGYRYYRPAQARDALTIGLLRTLEVPLPAVARVLSGDGGAEALRAARDRIEDDIARRRRALALLERVLAGGLPEAAVSVVREPARRVATAREAATPTTIAAATSACVRRLLSGRAPSGALVGLFPLDMAEEFDVRVVMEAPDGGDLLPGGAFAAATHTGPYEEIPLTVHGVLAWFGDHGHVPGGPVREVYLDDPATTAPERLKTQVMIRLEDE
ncbi:MerR family transcriptional regulator [Actinomadura roseirufa]|uniref:MerR family transcriptional regulator n=1 Tax=Actinomadura roseirufa TaxID=2094049 RepID=UPI00104149B7|nr:GyrI-like domain-containing protein [Actinomadura roseirufa]